MREKLLTYLFIIIAVPIAGELKFYPLDGGGIRVSLGTPVFFFILLWSRRIHPIFAGLITGLSVVFFRVFLYGIQMDTFSFADSFWHHFPVFFYYLTFALLFYILNLHTLYEKPFLIGLYGVIIEVVASMAEILLRRVLSHMPIDFSSFLVIAGIAVIRSFFVLGFFNILILRETRLAEEHQRKRNEQILLLISNLYVEKLQLKKSLKNAEELTSTCYSLYRDLKGIGLQEQAKAALKIAGEIHEIKKDNQRIYAGLSKLMVKENLNDYMEIEEIIAIIIRSNETYAEMLGKSIEFQVNISGTYPSYHAFTLLSLLNNLIANAVEAIPREGRIELSVTRNGHLVEIKVCDNGCGIPEKNKRFIFEPGFTTKFDTAGMASNGIGLSYMKQIIEEIGGEIKLLDSAVSKETTFVVIFPSEALTERG